MPVAALTLAQLLHTCAPNVGAKTMAAIVQVESGGNAYTIHDNTLRRSFSPVDLREAVAWSEQLLQARHSIDLGIAQINNANLPPLGLSITDAFDPCTNLRAGATILAYDYAVATRQFGPGQFALRRAIGAYNSGSIFAGDAYVDQILTAAGIKTTVNAPRVPELQSLGFAAPPILPDPTPRKLPASLVSAPPDDTSPLRAPILVQFATPTPTPTAAPSPAPAPAPNPSGSSAPSAAPSATPHPAAVILPAPH